MKFKGGYKLSLGEPLLGLSQFLSFLVRKLDTTSAYVNKLSHQERQKLIEQL